MSIKIMNWVWENSPYEGAALLVHLKLADHANDEGYCYPTQVGLARGARCSDRYVRTVLKQMSDDGFIELVTAAESGRRNNAYFLRNPTSTGTQFHPEPQFRSGRNHGSGQGGTSLPSNHQEPSENHGEFGRCGGCQRRHDPKESCF